MSVVVLVVLLIFGRPAGHFLGTAALMVAVTVAAGGAAVAAVLAFAAFGSVRRRRAVAGGCVNCRFRCQQAMTDQPRRLLVTRAAEREAATPQWPHRPAYRSRPTVRSGPACASAPASRPADRAGDRRERAGSAVLPDLGPTGPAPGMAPAAGGADHPGRVISLPGSGHYRGGRQRSRFRSEGASWQI
jgi:hypothetical protein